MLRLAEEILLLVLDEGRGELAPDYPPDRLSVVFAGAVLMELALEERIDTDLEHLVVTDPTPLGDDLLDPTLADITRDPRMHDTGFWIAHAAGRCDEIRDRALARLARHGILEFEAGGGHFLSRKVSRSRRYRTPDGMVVEHVRLRIMRVLFDDEIPDPRDIAIICLADACGVFERILSRSDLDQVAERIALVRRMDLIGRSVTDTLRRSTPPHEARPSVARRAREIPQAPGLPLAGNAIRMASDPRAFLIECYRTLGPVFRVRAFHRRFIVLAGPEANLFAARGDRYLRSHETWLDFNTELGASRSLVGMDGAEHVRMRRAHAGVYSRKLVEDRVGDAVRIARREIARWPEDEPVRGLYAFQRIVTEQLGILAVNRSPGEYLDDLILYVETLLSTHVARSRPRLMTWRPRFRRARRRLEEMVRKILEEHEPERRHGKPADFIDDLMDLHRDDPQFFPEVEWFMLVLGPFMAGLDTAAGIGAFMLYALLKHPDLLARVTAEADGLFRAMEEAGGTVGTRDLHQLDLIHRVAMETMRLYPLSPVASRSVANSFEFEGYTIPAGAEVLLGFSLAHHMPEWFPDPERFDIDRYTPERAEHRRKGVYAPFGIGGHQCLGRSLAEALIAINVATVVHEAELALSPRDYELETKLAPTLLPHDSFRFRIVRRRSPPRQDPCAVR